MQLYLDAYGTYLGVQNGMFWLRPKDLKPQLLAVREVSVICLTKGVSLSSNALILAMQNDIPVLILDEIEFPIAQVWSGQYGSIATIRKQQAKFTESWVGLFWVAELLQQKIRNQQQIIEGLYPGTEGVSIQRNIKVLEAIYQQFENWDSSQFNGDKERTKAVFRGWEGTASRQYFKAISAALPQKYEFPRRSRRPAYTVFNALLNYCYGMLYRLVHLALMKAGIDPFMGVLHADRYSQPTMVFDLIDAYRSWVDEIAILLCQKDLLPDDAFQPVRRNGYWLAPSGKKLVINLFFEQMNQKILYKGNVRKRSSHIELDCAKLATQLKNFKDND